MPVYRARLRAGMERGLERYFIQKRKNTARGVRRTINFRPESERVTLPEAGESPFSVFKDAAFTSNPVFFGALGVPVLAGAVFTVRSAAVLTVFVLASCCVCELLASAFMKDMNESKRTGLCSLAALAVIAALEAALWNGFSSLLTPLGIYLPMLAVCGLITARCETFASRSRPLAALADAAGTAVGFGLAAFMIGAAREYASSGYLFGIGTGRTAPALGSTFFVFIMLGFAAAAAQRTLYMHLVRRRAGRRGGKGERSGA